MTATQINFDQAAEVKPEPSPWDEGDVVTSPPSHSEATISANTRIEMPTDADGKHFAVWQFTFRSGYTYDDLAAAIDAIIFIHGSVKEAGGNMHDIVVGGVTLTPAASSDAPARQSSNGSDGQDKKWNGPGGWDADVNSAFMLATEVSLDFDGEGNPFVRVYDAGYFSKYGLSIYQDAKKGPSPIGFYGLEQVVSQGRPRVRFPLGEPLKVYYWYKEEDGKIKPSKGIVPYSMMEPDAAPADDRPVIHAGR